MDINKKRIQNSIPLIKKKLFGMQGNDGLLYKLLIYFLLITIGFVFAYPLFYMFITSLKSNLDLVDSTIQWIPSELHWANYSQIITAMNIPKTYFISIFVAGISTLSVVASSALIGYGLARFNFRGKKFLFAIMIITFVMPENLFFVPRYLIYGMLGLRGGLQALTVPAFLGQGIFSTFFILIFYQFFTMIPKQLEEAAHIDGASNWTIFYKIALPMAGPAIVITVIYCFALYWNETSMVSQYLAGSDLANTATVMLQKVESLYNNIPGGADMETVNLAYTEAKAYAGTLMSILPLGIFYLICQRWFIESIDKTGITGE